MTASYDLVERVRGAIGTRYVTASDSEVARALGVSRATIWGYKAGKQVMSLENFAAACELAGLPEQDVMELFGRLILESAGTDRRRQFWQRTMMAIRSAASRGRKAAAAVVLAVGTAALSGAPAPSQAATGDGPVSVYYGKSRRWGDRLAPA